MIAWWSLSALAADPAAEPEKRERHVTVVARGLVERWNDPAIATVYESGTWLGGLGVVVPFVGPLAVDAEISFSRLKANGTTLELAPLSAIVELGLPIGAATGFVGLGPALVVFTERSERAGLLAIDGARFTLEARGGIRVDTGLVDPPMAPAPSGPIHRLDVELYVARRNELPIDDEGFVLGAWRASLGLGLVF